MTPSREEFQAAVTERFDFLAETYGFEVGLDPEFDNVTYESPELCVEIWRESPGDAFPGVGWGSFSVYVDLRRKDIGSIYTIDEMLDALAPEEKRSRRCSGSDIAKLTGGLERLAELCQEHLGRLFRLDEDAFEVVESWVTESQRRYDLESRYGYERSKGDRAWEEKDWKAARAFYEDSRPALRPYQQRRLAFLRKRSPRL